MKQKFLLKHGTNTYFYKQLPVDKNNIFTADITEKNEVENIKFKTSPGICSDWTVHKPGHWFGFSGTNWHW